MPVLCDPATGDRNLMCFTVDGGGVSVDLEINPEDFAAVLAVAADRDSHGRLAALISGAHPGPGDDRRIRLIVGYTAPAATVAVPLQALAAAVRETCAARPDLLAEVTRCLEETLAADPVPETVPAAAGEGH